MKEMVILKLKNSNDRNAAEALKGKDVYIDDSQLRVLPEDVFYIKDLVGISIIDQEGNHIGVLKDVIQNSAQDLYEVKLENGKVTWIPAVEEFILDINVEEKFIKIRVIDGILDL